MPNPFSLNIPSKRGLLIFIALGYLSSCQGLAQDRRANPNIHPPKIVHIPKLSAPLKIDGALDEPVWSQAAEIDVFRFNRTSIREREGTRLKLWYDQEALYLGWLCKDTDIQATLKERDSRFWEEEVVEFFVTQKELTRYYELQWNPLGGVFDAIIHNELDESGLSKQFTGDWDYTAEGMQSAVHVKGTVGDATDQDDYWSVEVRVPFKALEATTPKAGDQWRGNFYRFSRGGHHEVEGLSWSPTRDASFHQPSWFGNLFFK